MLENEKQTLIERLRKSDQTNTNFTELVKKSRLNNNDFRFYKFSYTGFVQKIDLVAAK